MSMRLASILPILAILTSCATVPNTSIENLQGDIPDGNGLVVAETITNGERIVGPVRYWTEIVLWRVDYDGEDDTFSIDSLSYSLSTQAYMGLVPEGTYRVGMLYAFLQLGDRSFSARALAPPAIGTFEVRAGHVTNLGTFLYQPFQDRNWIDTEYPDYAMTRIPDDDLWESAKLANPHIAAQIDADYPVLGWNPDGYDAIRNDAARMIKEAALPTRIHALADGSFLFSGLLGGLYSLRDGAVQNFSLDDNYKITDVVELSNGQFLIGGELGKLGTSMPLGENVKYMPMEQRLAHILDIDRSGSGQAYVLSLTNDGYGIYQYDVDKGSLSFLKKLHKKKIGFIERGYIAYVEDIRHPNLIGTPEGIAIYFDKLVFRYDEQADQWSESEALEFNTMYQQRDGYITGTPYSSWSGTMPLRYSADGGLNWTESDETGGIFGGGASQEPTYRFSDGEFIRTGEDVDINFWTESEVLDEVPILSSTDNGVNWAPVGSIPRGCVTIAVESSRDELVHILCNNGAAISSTDRGRSWSESFAPRIPDFETFPGALKLRYQSEEIKSTSPPPPIITVD